MINLRFLIIGAVLAGICPAVEPPATPAVEYTVDLRASGAIPAGDNVIRECVARSSSLYCLVTPRRSSDRDNSVVVVTDHRGVLRRRISLGAVNPVSFCGVGDRRIRVFHILSGRAMVADFDNKGNLLNDYELESPPAGVIEAPNGDLVALLTDSRFSLLVPEGRRFVLRRSTNTAIPIRPKACSKCADPRVLLPGEFLLSWLSPGRVAAVEKTTATAWYLNLTRWQVEKIALRTPEIEYSIADYASVRRNLRKRVGPSTVPMDGIVVLSAAADSRGNLALLLAPYRKAGAVVETFDRFGVHRATLLCRLDGLRSDGKWHLPNLVTVAGRHLLLISGSTGFLATYRY